MGFVSSLWCSFDSLTSKILQKQGIISEKKCRIDVSKNNIKVEMRALGQILGISILQTLFSEV